jgi:hypothetical protein
MHTGQGDRHELASSEVDGIVMHELDESTVLIDAVPAGPELATTAASVLV